MEELKEIIQEPVKAIEFAGFKCCIRIELYANKSDDNKDRAAIILEDIEDGEQVAVATINMPEEILKKDEVIIKNYSENDGILNVLVSANIISVPIGFTKQGNFPICKLLLPCPTK